MMKAEPLSEHMHFFRTVAELKFQEFSYLTGEETIDDYLKRQQKYVTDEPIPKSFVVLDDAGNLLGTFALKLEDLSTRPDLSPWLDVKAWAHSSCAKPNAWLKSWDIRSSIFIRPIRKRGTQNKTGNSLSIPFRENILFL